MIQRGNCKGTHFSRNLNQETSKKETEDKKKRYKSLVSWEDEQPFNIYEFLLAKDIDMEM